MFGIAGYINLSAERIKLYKVGGTGSDSLNMNMPEEFPNRYEAGSLNSVGIYSVNKSIDFLIKANFAKIEKSLVEYFLNGIKNENDIIVYLPNEYISNGIVSINKKGYSSDELGMILSEDYGICVRSGFHCAPIVHDFIKSKNFNGTVRISFSGFNTFNDVDILLNALKEI
jgi:selenocysteine lyase/cysteine desulfurase